MNHLPSTANGSGAVFTPPLPANVQVNPIRTQADWNAMREACATDTGAFHGDIAKRELHWYHPQLGAWLSLADDGVWRGWDAGSGEALECRDWTPWEIALDEREAPFYRWFVGARTNAAFNEIDRHILAGHGAEIAFHYEGDRWDATANGGRGGPVHRDTLTRRELLVQSCVCALALRELGLGQGDRIALNMPNILEQIVWTEAAKRLGIVYTPVFGGFSDKTLADRIEDAGARVVITADGASRNAENVPFKQSYTDPALDNFLSLAGALVVVAEAGVPETLRAALLAGVREGLAGEITVARNDVMREIGRVLDGTADLDSATAAGLRADLAEALTRAPARVETVIVVRHLGLTDVPWVEGRDVWAESLIADAETKLCSVAGVSDMAGLRALSDPELVAALWRSAAPLPVAADFPLFVIYTSGSTGKPKGVVHVHGGYLAGLIHTMKVSFDAVPERDVMYVVADPGWITGQSYLIAASLGARIPSVVTEGSPVFPNAGRFASIIERHRVTLFKAGVTFLKTVMVDPQNRADVEIHDLSSLRVATFCAEPVSPAVQRFGMELMTPWYINSYWATEHGGIVWTHPYGNPDQRLRADAHTYPLPWVFGDVWLTEGEPDATGRTGWRRAADGEKGEIVITRPYPYLARTIWGDPERVTHPDWKGDIERFTATYYGRYRDAGGRPAWVYLQGDFARRHAGGSFSLHGRSDDVINVSGHRMGTEEIEGAILKDKQLNPDSPVGNCVVIGAPHRDKGLTPVAFVIRAGNRRLNRDDVLRLEALVRAEKGAFAVPSDFIELGAFPETRSGKYMRRFLANLLAGAPLGDTTTLRNPECLAEITEQIAHWRRAQRRAAGQTLIERRRFIRTQYDPVGVDGHGTVLRVATVVIDNPPVNALSERVLDDLDTEFTHIARRDDVRAVVITGAGNRSFVAGADVRQLLEEVHTLAEARALPSKAHAVFSRIESLDKPVIAALGGVALGGGCELAMACHYRIADRRARLAQPEINLFLPPGYGGTQRLPRLLAATGGDEGLRAALGLLLSGRQIDAPAALRLGLIDRLAHGPEDALSLAQQVACAAVRGEETTAIRAMRKRHRQVAEWQAPVVEPTTVSPDPYLRDCIAQARRAGRGAVAQAIIDLVRGGLEQGFRAGLQAEQACFARFVIDAEEGGKHGIRLFLDKQSPPLMARPRPHPDELERQAGDTELLPVGAPFFPGITPLPRWQHAWAVVRDRRTGEYLHGDPATAEAREILPVPVPGPNQALVYLLASEINFNDVWAITGVPVSLFDEHDEDVHVTGSGGVGLVVRLGEALQAEGRLTPGALVAIYSGVSDLLAPESGRDPMFTDFHIQGYQSPDGSHQQFLLADGPQLLPPPAGLTLEAAGSYILTAGTVYRALYTTLDIRPRSRLLIEGAAGGTGGWAVAMGLASRGRVTGLVSSSGRAAAVERRGARAVNRRAPGIAECFRRVPEARSEWPDWAAQGAAFLAAVRAANEGELCDFALSHAGETAFPRSFQALAPGGALAFYGATSGYHMTFLGKPGRASAADMLGRARLRAGEAVLIFYGTGGARRDDAALAALEAARAAGARIVVVTDTDAERDFVLSLGFGDAVAGALSLAELARRKPEFAWPETLPELPDPKRETARFKEAVRRFAEFSFKPLGGAVGALLRSGDNPRGMPDLVVERAHRDSLAIATMLVKPHRGRVVYTGDMDGRRYSFYAPQVWMRQRRIVMPGATIFGTHLSNAAEIADLNRMIEAGGMAPPEPHLGAWTDLPGLHQAMWENRLPEHTGGGNNAVLNHALPEAGLKHRDELYQAWIEAGSSIVSRVIHSPHG